MAEKMENIIQTSHLTKRYGSKIAVNDLNLSIHKGEVFGLLGPNGAGKTTTILMLLGLTEPTAGTAEIAGCDCTRNPLEVKSMVGYLPDNVGFYGDMTGRQNLRFTGRLNGMHGKELEERIDYLLDRVGMTDAADQEDSNVLQRYAAENSGIADVLMKDPQVIIMDEPTLGIDPGRYARAAEPDPGAFRKGWAYGIDIFSSAAADSAGVRPGRHLCTGQPDCMWYFGRTGSTDPEERHLSA